MDGIRLGACMLWRPATSGISALVTVVALNLEKDQAQVHVTRTSTQTCAAHWVDMNQLSEAPRDARPCSCLASTGHDGQDNDAA
jgi:hypothetical protein